MADREAEASRPGADVEAVLEAGALAVTTTDAALWNL